MGLGRSLIFTIDSFNLDLFIYLFIRLSIGCLAVDVQAIRLYTLFFSRLTETDPPEGSTGPGAESAIYD